MAMKVIIQSRKLIKPTMSTPLNLRYYKIGFIDELAPKMNVSLVLFFSASTNCNQTSIAELEKSFGKTLSILYPLAGRYMKDLHMVDCNDQGAEFIQAHVNMTLHEIIDQEMNLKLVNELIPLKVSACDEVTDPALAAQVTTFQCGGVALGISIAHRIADASTACTFLNLWAALCRRDTSFEFYGLGFSSSKFFPPRGLPCMDLISKPINDSLYVTKKLSFKESEISNLKDMVMCNRKYCSAVSKVQVVSALIWKALIGVDYAIHGHLRDSRLAQPVNLREKTETPIPKNACGNLWGFKSTSWRASEMSMEFEELVCLLTDSIKKTINDYSKVRHDSKDGQMVVLNSFPLSKNNSDNANVIILSSWCKFPLYESDFGFGKPICLSLESIPVKKFVYLVDDVEGGGVEAYVYLGVDEVPYLEQDVNIKAFAA
ncbi:pelargonidin 3-O-(6-caffeoylglucoside) 5-O-(6-O-malonylglucoside) 4'''-malonyltransferase-like protein [Tanacetum coccineum]